MQSLTRTLSTTMWMLMLNAALCSPALAQVDMYQEGIGMLQQLMHRDIVKADDGLALGSYPRVDIAMGGIERFFSILDSDPEGLSLGWLLTEKAAPSVRPHNYFTLGTKSRWVETRSDSFEQDLYLNLMNAGKELRPSQVFGAALDSCENEYLLAMLTAHNLLKEMTYAGREGQMAVLAYDYAEPEDTSLWTTVSPEVFTSRLANLRQAGDPHYGDKMGPWYHMFGLFFIGGLTSTHEAELASWIENGLRYMGVGSGGDGFKEAINNWSVGVCFGVSQLMSKEFYIPERLDTISTKELGLIREEIALMQQEARADTAFYSAFSGPTGGYVLGQTTGGAAMVELALLAEQKRVEDEIGRRVKVGGTEMRTN